MSDSTRHISEYPEVFTRAVADYQRRLQQAIAAGAVNLATMEWDLFPDLRQGKSRYDYVTDRANGIAKHVTQQIDNGARLEQRARDAKAWLPVESDGLSPAFTNSLQPTFPERTK